MNLLDKYLPRSEFTSYEDFIENYSVNIPEGFNFGFDVIDEWAKLEPEKRALVWCDDHGGERIFTFTDLAKLSNKVVNWFQQQGIGKGDKVMLILRRRFEYWISAIALHKLGAVVIPASLQLTSKDITYRVKAADIKMLVCVNDDFVIGQVDAAEHSAKKAIISGSHDGWLLYDYENYSDVFERPSGELATKNTDLMLVYFTSGTTGMPKMVQHNFMHPVGQIVTAKYWQQVENNGLHMSVADSGWAKFGWGKIYGQMFCGCAIFGYDMDKFVAKNLLEKMQHYKLTSFCAPPTMYRFMLQENLENYDLSSIKHCGNAGEPLNPEVYNKFKKLTDLELREGFGQSESTVLIANFGWIEPRVGSMGKPAPLYDIDLVDADGKPCDPGVEGEIIIRGLDKPNGLFAGYYQDEQYNARVFHDDAYFTGDVAWRDDDGYYWFVGRNDDVIKCSGYRIGPFEVESALMEHESVVECAVTAVPDPVRGQIVKASVVLRKDYTPSDELVKTLQNHVKKVTAPYKYPRIVEFVSELPKTISGKIKRAEIRKSDQT